MEVPDSRPRDLPSRLLAIAGVVLPLLMALTIALPASASDAPPRQSAKEADQAMKELMAKRSVVRGVTSKGKTVAEAPPFKVYPRKPALTKYPCTSCHDNSFVDGRVRVLKDEHSDLVFDHGGGKLWCYDACHNGRDMDHLTTLRHRQVDYDRADQVCGQCHFEKLKDWSFGGHGRQAGAWPEPAKVPLTHDQLRVVDRTKIASWKGERTMLSCTACHNAHSPAIKPFEPSPPPQVRSGLARPVTAPETHTAAWQQETETKGKKP